VLEFGGAEEVCVAVDESTKIAGVVSTEPAHLMNGQLQGTHVVPVALLGRVPCLVQGPVFKGDFMVSAGNGRAKATAYPSMGRVVGRALQDFAGDLGTIEIVVGRT
jgi:hypothetical protein